MDRGWWVAGTLERGEGMGLSIAEEVGFFDLLTSSYVLSLFSNLELDFYYSNKKRREVKITQ